MVLEPLLNAPAVKDYITARLQPALSKALTSLAREKPSAERFEALTYLANFLLQNNPNKPRIISPEEWDPSLEVRVGGWGGAGPQHGCRWGCRGGLGGEALS